MGASRVPGAAPGWTSAAPSRRELTAGIRRDEPPGFDGALVGELREPLAQLRVVGTEVGVDAARDEVARLEELPVEGEPRAVADRHRLHAQDLDQAVVVLGAGAELRRSRQGRAERGAQHAQGLDEAGRVRQAGRATIAGSRP